MRVISLASGSSGNALVVTAGATRVLVDAGLQPRILQARLRQAGVAPESLAAILLTHEHHDHACGALELAVLHHIPVIADPLTWREVRKASAATRVEGSPEYAELRVGADTSLGALAVRSFPVSHDAVAPCGFVLSSGAWSVCVAVDSGEVTTSMIEALRSASLMVIEANHDEARLQSGPYPWHLKQRIRSARGHLSNAQTAAALALALDDGPRWVWLAHLSRTNNTPDLARTTVHVHLRGVGLGQARVQVAPPGFGPIWDSATLWTDAAHPTADVRTAAPPAPAAVAPAATVREPASDG